MVKHAVPEEWSGSLAIANIGLSGRAIMGRKWPRHRAKLFKQLTGMLEYGGGKVCGLCLCEVGSLQHPLTNDVRERVKELIEEVFENSSAAEHGRCNIVWPQGVHPGETLTAWRGDIFFEVLSQMSRLPKQLDYRVVERLLVLHKKDGGAAEHAILVYNNHQPASENHDFPKSARVKFCKIILPLEVYKIL